jgi:DNA segregation ATPase FtsK/SpoIIIE-like protein
MEKNHAMSPLTRAGSLLALTAALATAGCNRNADAPQGNAQAQFALPALPATLPLEAGEATPVDYAPPASDLPDAAPLPLARVADPAQAYGYADAAYSYDEALGDAPPDYGFDYEGSDPWAWQGYDDSTMFAEPIDDGYRYYYYRAGADEPYFIRDPYYSYGFANGLLAVIYAADGGIVPYADYGPRLAYASRYYARGRGLWTASRRARRQPVIAGNWLRARPAILASRERWGAGRAHQPGWQRFYEVNRPRQATYWRAEQLRRQADARRFADWRQQGFRSSPPPRAIPVAWQNAKWARDDRRYRPAAEALRERREDRQQADRREARQDRLADRRQDQARADRQDQRRQALAQRQQNRQQADRGERRDVQQAERQQAQRQAERAQRQQQAERQAERQQRAQTDRRGADRRGDEQRQARQAERQRQQAERQRQQADRQRVDTGRGQAEQAQQRQAAQAERRQAQQAERAQRQQAQEAGRRQAEQAQRREAQQAERAQRQQAREAGQRQAEQAQRQQAQQVERQQAQAQRQQQQQARQAERQQAEQARQAQPRPAQPRGDGPRGGGGRRGGDGPN